MLLLCRDDINDPSLERTLTYDRDDFDLDFEPYDELHDLELDDVVTIKFDGLVEKFHIHSVHHDHVEVFSFGKSSKTSNGATTNFAKEFVSR
jgi:hypothetical protein